MKRRDFIKNIGLAGAGALVAGVPTSVAANNNGATTGAQGAVKDTDGATAVDAKKKSGFTLWQVATQVNTIGNSYVIRTDKGRIIVIDGGAPEELSYMRGFLGALGNEVTAWFVTHPHIDHMGVLNELLKAPGDVKIKHIYYSRFSKDLMEAAPNYVPNCKMFYENLDASPVPRTDIQQAGEVMKFDGLNLKILGVTNHEIRTNPFNNSSMVYRLWDNKKSVVILGDAGVENGNKLLAGPYAKDLDCDYLQVAHHGQRGCDEHFYKTVNFRACLWCTPTWVWNNDAGEGINTAHLKTFDTRGWMDDKGIKEHHVSCLEGLWRLD